MKKTAFTVLIFVILFGCNQVENTNKSSNQKLAKDDSQKVFLLMFDGLRWQELFTGADSLLINDKKYSSVSLLNKKFWKNTPEERREILMPFFWNTIAKEGQIYGNRAYGNNVDLENSMWFSYPGYNETLCGFADDEIINSNAKNYNPNKTILELVNNLPEFKGKVGAFGSWDVFPYIINEQRSGINVNAGYREASGDDITDNELFLNKLQKQAVRVWEGVRQDVFTHNYAFEFVKKHHPKLLFISYGETDDFAHEGNYTHYLFSAANTDAMIKELWDYCQSEPYYKGKTTFIITTDHGRGSQPLDSWRDHGGGTKGSGQTWIAVIGAAVQPKGELKEKAQLSNNQIATTIQKILGVNVLTDKSNKEVLPFLKK